MNEEPTYQEIKPVLPLQELIDSFWMHKNTSDDPEHLTIVPDGYFKIVIVVQEQKVVQYFMTGMWISEKNFVTPPKATNYGCRLKLLAPEYLISQEIASFLQGYRQLNSAYLDLKNWDLSSFQRIVDQWQQQFLGLMSSKPIANNKLRLSQILDQKKGDISAKQVSEQIFWTNRQINRYLNRYLGISLKKYLNIQKVYQSYIQIREGRFFPDKTYFDQAHFIREVKKHTGETPSTLYDLKNDRFIQLKNIRRK